MRTLMTFAMIALGLIGLVAGLMVGLSQTAVVSTVLPLIFGLIAGGGGFALFRLDPGKAGAIEQMRAAYAAIAAFSVCFLVAMLAGIEVRTESRLWSLEATIEDAETSPQQAVELIAVRRGILALGASRREQKALLRDLVAQRSQARSQFADLADQCAALAATMAEAGKTMAAEPVIPEASDIESEDLDLKQAGSTLRALAGFAERCAQVAAEAPAAAFSLLETARVGARDTLSNWVETDFYDDPALWKLEYYDGAAAAVVNLYATLAQIETARPNLTLDIPDPEGENEVDVSDILLPGRGLASTDPPEITYNAQEAES